MIQQSLEPYYLLLNKYSIEPEYIDDFGKLKKIYTNRGIFALKQVKFSEGQRTMFMHTVQNLHEKGYRHAVPIYLTYDGNYLCRQDGYDFYLMPWIESNRMHTGDYQGNLMKEAARIHSTTTTNFKTNQQYFQQFYESAKFNIEKRKLDYERFIEKCEKKVYMSPFELLYCTYFTQFMRFEEIALRHLEDWYEAAKTKKQSRAVICHGNLAPDHLICDGNGHSYLINFDRTFMASPIYDLLYSFRKMFYQYPQASSNALHWYDQYNRNYHLTEDERLLLFYYLTQTEKINKIVQQYDSELSSSERNSVVKLQRSIWQLRAANSFVHQINEMIEQANNEMNEDGSRNRAAGSAIEEPGTGL